VLGEMVAFIGVAVLVICTPGQDTALTIRSSLAGGRRAGVATAAGVALGQAAWTVATAIGLASLLVASQPLFLALRVAGAVVLVVLGTQLLVGALRRSESRLVIEAGAAVAPGRAFRQGLLSNLANPKMAVFFTSLLPQFAPTSGPAFPVLLGLGLVLCAMTFAWLAVYSVAVGWAWRVLLRGRVRRALDAVTGVVLVALGLRIAVARP
jgi:threonine/homoserine/homoserine lactone efflux protein